MTSQKVQTVQTCGIGSTMLCVSTNCVPACRYIPAGLALILAERSTLDENSMVCCTGMAADSSAQHSKQGLFQWRAMEDCCRSCTRWSGACTAGVRHQKQLWPGPHLPMQCCVDILLVNQLPSPGGGAGGLNGNSLVYLLYVLHPHVATIFAF